MDQGIAAPDATGIAFRTVDLAIAGMSCAACAGRVERALAAVPGVATAAVNLATHGARVAGVAEAAALLRAVERAGYRATVPDRDPAGMPSRLDDPAHYDRLAALAALALATPLLLPMLIMPLGLHLALPGWAQLALAGVVQFGLGARFYRGAWAALRTGVGSMDTLIALGTSAAFGLSALNLAHTSGPLYFEASAGIVAFVRLGKYLELRARRDAGQALRALQRLRPERARIVRDGMEHDLPASALQVGDILAIRPGERIAADGVVTEGAGSADESLLTGESLPLAKAPGSILVGGALNGEAPLRARVTASGAEGRLARMVRLVEDAQATKPPVQRLVDRVSAVFVPVVMAIALATFLGWWAAGAGVGPAVIHAVAVLVIACPCALGLATPAAILVGTGVAARHGILIRDPAAIERAHALRTVVFDKTGTLTEGRPDLLALHPAPGQDAATVLGLAASLQSGSAHPLARAVLAHVTNIGTSPASAVRTLPGRGIEGVVGGRVVRLGTARMLRDVGIDLAPLAGPAAALAADGRTVAYLADSREVLGLFGFGDAIKPTASAAVAALQRKGLRVVLLTGDNAMAAAATARALGIADVRADALPEDKVAQIAALRAEGAVAMVGDGVNDAAALAAADLGLAMATGTDAAAAAAAITLMRGDPMLVLAALDIAARIFRRIRSGLFWAFAYNVVGIPLAAAGLLSPVLAAAAMALSSLGVMGSALLLRRWRPAVERPVSGADS